MKRNPFPKLTALLNSFVDQELGEKPKKKPCPYYAEFRKIAKRLGLTYKVSNDGFIDLSNGDMFPHYNWSESLERIQDILNATESSNSIE